MKEFFNGKVFIITVLIAAFCIGFVINAIFDGGTTLPENILATVFSPLQTVASKISNRIDMIVCSWTDYDELLAENEKLKSENITLKAKAEESVNLENENKELRDLLGFVKTVPEYKRTEARVISVSDSKTSSSFTINRGTSSGINKKDVVISTTGLVGYIKDVGVNWATVLTILDPGFSVGIYLPRTDIVAMTEGTVALKSEGKCRLAYLENTSVINRGDVVLTSGLGGLFPEGLAVGTISEVTVNDNGLSQYGIVTPAVDFSKLRKVCVLSSEEEK